MFLRALMVLCRVWLVVWGQQSLAVGRDGLQRLGYPRQRSCRLRYPRQRPLRKRRQTPQVPPVPPPTHSYFRNVVFAAAIWKRGCQCCEQFTATQGISTLLVQALRSVWSEGMISGSEAAKRHRFPAFDQTKKKTAFLNHGIFGF